MVWTHYVHVNRMNVKKDVPGKTKREEPEPDGKIRLGKILKIEDKHGQQYIQLKHGRRDD